MAQTDCWITHEPTLRGLSGFFSEVDQTLSRDYEDEMGASETSFDGALGQLLKDGRLLARHMGRLNKTRDKSRLPKLYFGCKMIHHSETIHGADVGLVLRLDIPGEQVLSKASLIQTKRLYPNTLSAESFFSDDSEYREIYKKRNRIIKLTPEQASKELPFQWDRMLAIDQNSCYLLYGPEKFHSKDATRTGTSELGIRIVEATKIKGLSDSNPGVSVSLSAKQAWQMSSSFSEWMVNSFICCKAGSTSQLAIETALGRNLSFPVRSTLSTILTTNRNPLALEYWEQ